MQTAGHPSKDWLEGELDLQFMANQSEELTRFWLHEVDLLMMRRHWLRWAFEFLQRFRRVTDGTPVDIQLGTYLIDADLFVSADKVLIWIASRCRLDAPFVVAEPVKEKWLRMFGQSFLRINKVTALRFQAAIAAPVLLK
jgi:hypothetical protein